MAPSLRKQAAPNQDRMKAAREPRGSDEVPTKERVTNAPSSLAHMPPCRTPKPLPWTPKLLPSALHTTATPQGPHIASSRRPHLSAPPPPPPAPLLAMKAAFALALACLLLADGALAGGLLNVS